MDFSADGGILLLADDNDTLFLIDTSDGSMTPAGDVGLNVSAMSYRVPEPMTVAVLALVGVGLLRRR
jgi:hypothetical protein